MCDTSDASAHADSRAQRFRCTILDQVCLCSICGTLVSAPSATAGCGRGGRGTHLRTTSASAKRRDFTTSASRPFTAGKIGEGNGGVEGDSGGYYPDLDFDVSRLKVGGGGGGGGGGVGGGGSATGWVMHSGEDACGGLVRAASGVLQCVAVCCIVLYFVAVCVAVCVFECVLQCVVMHSGENACGGLVRDASGVLQCAAVCNSVLQCVAVCCSVLQCVLQCVAVCCSVLQCVLQCVLQFVLQCVL